MQLLPGTKLGPYEIISLIGAGGMGEVYRARDPRIGREVAIKILPETFTADTDRLRRFEQEAHAAGVLNHPGILSIFDIGTDLSRPYIVSELLEGETLREKLQTGPLMRRKAIEYALQIASALATAHDKGIVHRDLKPENIFITREGRAKILDFGLAKLIYPDAPAAVSNQSKLQTLEGQSTPGMMLGTVGYMSPEQVRGLSSDHRSDIFAFGVVLYEMLTGKRAFQGNTNADTLSTILQKDPPELSESNPDLSLPLVRIIQHCLEKNPEERLQSMRDIRIYLETLSGLSGTTVTSTALPPPAGQMRRIFPWVIASLLAIATAVFAIGYFQRIPKPKGPVSFSINAPVGISFDSFAIGMAVSPDGTRLVFGAPDENGKFVLWDRQFNNPIARPLPGTEETFLYPFWSPDSRNVGFFAEGKLKTIDINSEAVRILCDAPAGRGGTWNRKGWIVFAPDKYGALFRVAATGGQPEQVTITPKEGVSYRWPSFLPDDSHFLFSDFDIDQSIKIGSLDSKEEKILVRENSNAFFAPPNHVLFAQNGRLIAQQLDLKRLELKGEAISISNQNVVQNHARAFAAFTVSAAGVLTYQADTVPPSRLVIVDRSGKRVAEVGEPGYYSYPRFSPDGKKLSVARHQSHIEPGDIWLLDLMKGTMSRFTFEPQLYGPAVWTPDGKKIQYGERDLFEKPVSGTTAEKPLFKSGLGKTTFDVSSDGKYQLFALDNRQTLLDVWVLPLFGEGKPFPFVATPHNENTARFSPDGKWVAYDSSESGKEEVYVRAFPDADAGKWQISNAGGVHPVWRGDGKEIFYRNGRNIMASEITLNPEFESGTPKILFETALPTLADDTLFDVSRDGERFVLSTPPDSQYFSSVTVVLNWMTGIPKDR